MEESTRSLLVMFVPLVASSLVERHQPFGFSNITLVRLLQYKGVLIF